MKHNNVTKIVIGIVLFFMMGVGAKTYAQEIEKEWVNIVAADLQQEGDVLHVAMQLDLQQLQPNSQSEIVLTPVLVGKENRMQLPEIVIYSHTSYKAYKRSMALEKDQPNLLRTAYVVLKSKKELVNPVDYTLDVPYEDWMRYSKLVIEGDVCGCGRWEPVAEQRVAEFSVYDFTPELAYIQPDREAIKKRKEDTEVFIDFKVNQSVIIPDLMNNRAELNTLNEALATLSLDKNLTVNQVYIVGYASPEGSIAVNENLSKRRAEELKKYLTEQAHFPSDIYQVRYGGENWEGLVEMLEESSLDTKEEVLSIISNTPDANTRKNKLKAFNKGKTYNYMLANFYPKLRKTVVDIRYDVRDFTVEEAKEILNTRPGQLSLNEMFQVAKTYPKGGEEFTKVFNKAVVLYPDSKVANLNAGAAALAADDMELAEKYLDKANPESPEYFNNMGVYYYKRGELAKAKSYFVKSAQGGSEVGQKNLTELNEKIKVEKIPL